MLNKNIFFQSISSVGPALNYFALLPVMALFSGRSLPTAVLVSFIISFVSFLPIIIFSSRTKDERGYSAYAEIAANRIVSNWVGFNYICYSILVLPNIILFSVSFLNGIFGFSRSLYIPISLLLFLLVIVPVWKGKSIPIKIILILSALEIGGILLISFSFLFFGTSKYSFLNENGFWTSVLIGILMFSGSGSGIFLSGESKNQMELQTSLTLSYLISGILMILASIGIVLFLPNLADYSSNPSYLILNINAKFGIYLSIFMLILFLFSAYNLSLSYYNALNHMRESFFKKNMQLLKNQSLYFFTLIIFVNLIIFFAGMITGYYLLFTYLIELVSLLYISVHLITIYSFLFYKQRSITLLTTSIISLIILGIVAYENLISNGTYFISLVICLFIITFNFLLSLYLNGKNKNYAEISVS
ncbi:hypothetical protein [Caldiplasma sukawensis]